ncbi:hypothetical protein D9M69_534750 [compost metagenome]
MQSGAPATDYQLRSFVHSLNGGQRSGDKLILVIPEQCFADQVLSLTDAQQQLEVRRQSISSQP